MSQLEPRWHFYGTVKAFVVKYSHFHVPRVWPMVAIKVDHQMSVEKSYITHYSTERLTTSNVFSRKLSQFDAIRSLPS